MLGITPGQAEIAASQKALAAWRKQGTQPAGGADASREHFVWALINHNDFVTLR